MTLEPEALLLPLVYWLPLAALVEKITTNAGLDSHFRDGRWDVYSRSHAKM